MDNCISTTRKLLSLLNVAHTGKYIRDTLLSHPDHPSLLAISDTLHKYKIENFAVKTTFDSLREFPLPCIVQVSIQGNPFFYVLKSVSENKVVSYDEKGKLISLSKKDFIGFWTGICLLAEKSAHSAEEGIRTKSREKKITLGLNMVLALILSWWVIATFNPSGVIDEGFLLSYPFAFFAIKAVGLSAAILLLWWEVDQTNSSLQSFCTGGKKMNCSAVLTSNYSKVFGETFSLSIIGFSYFFGSLSFILISGISKSSLALLSYGSLAAIPVILFSAYYQAVVIKQWCKLCIVVQAVLVMEIIVVFLGTFYKAPIEVDTIPLLLALLLIPIFGWKILKPLLNQEKENTLYKRQLRKIKNNPEVLRSLMLKSRKISTSTEGLGIAINSNTAKYTVLKVCNPYCGPCSNAHPVLERLVDEGKINLQILFTATPDISNKQAQPVRHFLAIDAKGNERETRSALDRWYSAKKKDYKKFAIDYPMNGDLLQQTSKIGAMRAWCDAEKITHTPTIFVDGYELPREYSIEDLKDVLI